MIYCNVDGTGTGDSLKQDCFFHLKEISKISVELCNILENGGAREEKTASEYLERSRQGTKKCIEHLERVFLPPIDREDALHLTILLHRLNTRIVEAFCFKVKFFDRLPAGISVETIKNAVYKIDSVLSKDTTLDYSYAVTDGDSIGGRDIFTDRYNPTSELLKMRLCDRLERCCDTANDIMITIAKAKIKLA